jgi:hypothetical protein
MSIGHVGTLQENVFCVIWFSYSAEILFLITDKKRRLYISSHQKQGEGYRGNNKKIVQKAS